MTIHKVLVVDDSPTERFHLIEILKQHGYVTDSAENGIEGIAKAKGGRPDLILMDVVMPDMNGFQATRMLSRDEVTKNIPVIICTSKNQETDRVWGLRQGAVAYLVKPVAADQLLEQIRSMG